MVRVMGFVIIVSLKVLTNIEVQGCVCPAHSSMVPSKVEAQHY